MVQFLMAVAISIFTWSASAQTSYVWSGNELEPIAAAWIMGKQVVTSDQFASQFTLQLSALDSTAVSQDPPMWFRFTGSSLICDVQVGTKSKLVQAAQCGKQ